ncbi:DUF222 domain-containing protein [Agromyces sp. NPDC057865]|uniref:HNH endonuclease signature motif containing protein n=1 Tax=Agromyces sp. NPDC057865 TaxID=3346267 RepID=UPI00366BD1E0
MKPPIARPATPSIERDLEGDLADDLDSIVALERIVRVAQAEQRRLVRRARERAALLDGVHEGSTSSDREFATRSFIAELATTLVVAEARALGMVGDAARLAELPSAAAAFTVGDLGLAQVHTVMEVTSGASVELSARLELEAIERAPRQTNASLRRSLRRLRERLEPRALEERRASAEADRRVCVDPAADGMAWLSVYMQAERAYAIKARLDAIVARSAEVEAAGSSTPAGVSDAASLSGAVVGASSDPRAPAAASVARPDHRTLTQRVADLVGDLLPAGTLEGDPTGFTALGAVTPRILVTVPVLSLLGQTNEPAELDGYGPIDAETARRIAAHAPSFQRILTHPETGAFLSYGRTSYRVPADLAGYLAVRDGRCRFPGCGRRARSADIDHTVDWADGGSTSHENLAYLCRKHHRLKHRTRWRMTQEHGGVIRWTSPAGHILRTYPERPFIAVPTDAAPGPEPGEATGCAA